jgi:hypothetical protein
VSPSHCCNTTQVDFKRPTTKDLFVHPNGFLDVSQERADLTVEPHYVLTWLPTQYLVPQLVFLVTPFHLTRHFCKQPEHEQSTPPRRNDATGIDSSFPRCFKITQTLVSGDKSGKANRFAMTALSFTL